MSIDFKLGKLNPVPLVGVCDLAEYALEAIPSPPNYTPVPRIGNYSWQMFGNDQYGDCVIAGAAHMDMAWNFEVKESDPIPSETEAVTEYFDLTGGQDTGLAETPTLQHWMNKGLFGYRISAFAPVPHWNCTDLKTAIAFYGGAYFGVQLPQSAQDQFNQNAPSTWSVVNGSPIVGGHCICGVGYNTNGIQIITWGQVVTCTWEWIEAYVDEAYAIIPKQFVEAGKGPLLDIAALRSDLKAV